MAKQESRSSRRKERPSAKRRRQAAEGRGRQPKQPDWRVGELYIERRGSRSIVGNIYKGRVDNVLPGLEAAFVDIGIDKNGFLHADDVVMPGVEIARRGRHGSKGKRISEVLKPGDEVVVQVVKDPLKTKGARLSMQLSIAGPLPRLRARRRGHRRLAPADRQGARPAAQAGEGARPRQGRRDHPHRRAGRQARGLRARGALPAQALRGPAEARQGDARAGDGLPGGRPPGARHPRHLLRAVREGDRRRREGASPARSRSSRAPRPSCSTGSSSTRARSRCSRSTASRRRSRRRSAAGSTCPRAAT